MTTIFITGIDTDVGKSVACGALANSLLQSGHHVFTQKWVETGCDMVSQDLETHAEIAQTQFNTSAQDLHSPYRFEYPASPHLSAELANSEIDTDYLVAQTKELETQCQHLLIEGAGGLCVPLNKSTLLIDLIKQLSLSIILVTSSKLGSINHTILSLKTCQQYNIDVKALIYNHFPRKDDIIFNDSRETLQAYLRTNNQSTLWLELEQNSKQIALSNRQIEQLLC